MSNNVTQELQKTAFGELQVAQRDPEIQISAEYNTLSEVRTIAVGAATAGVSDGQFVVTSGTGANDLAAIFTDRQIISRPGQGSEVIFTAKFDQGLANSRQAAGPSSASDSMFFGYNDTEFGVFFNHGGMVVIEELTITVPSAGGSVVITVNGIQYIVPLTTGTVEHNASEITEELNSQVPLFNFTQNGNQVVARSIFAAPESGAFSFTSNGVIVASWFKVNNGLMRTEEFTPQDEWSEGNVLEQTLDPSMLNRYKIVHNGSVDYYIEDGITGLYALVHRRVHTNVETTPMFSTASFRITWAVTNTGNTTDHSVSGSEASAFNQGERQQITATKSAFNSATGIGTDATNIISIRCREVFGDKVNLGRIIPTALTAFTDGNKGAIVQIRKGVTFATETNFAYVDKIGSIAETESSPIEVTGGELLASITIGSSAAASTNEFNNLLLPGEVLTISMNVPSAAGADMNASIVWEEDL